MSMQPDAAAFRSVYRTATDLAAERSWRAVRRLWRAGFSQVPSPPLLTLISSGAPAHVADRVADAVTDLVERGRLTHTGTSMILTPSTRVVLTLHDEVLDHIAPAPIQLTTGGNRVSPARAHRAVAQTLSEHTDLALRKNPDRTVEYLARARHQMSSAAGRALAEDAVAAHATRAAALFLAGTSPLPADTADAIARDVLGLPARPC